MGYNATLSNCAIGNGGAGNPDVWDIFTADHCDLAGRIVAAFMCLDENGGTFEAMSEETTMARKPSDAAVNTPVAANKLAYTYPQYIIFEGRYTVLTPTRGNNFKVWFLK